MAAFMAEPRKVVRCAIYCRISKSDDDNTVKVDDQEKICRELAARRGWTVEDHHVYKDNSKSAWLRNRKRPGWDAMLAAIEAGEIDAIVVYHGDRLIRQPFDLEKLLLLADTKDMKLAAPTGQRDLDNADDRFILRIEVASNCRESDNTSRRTKRHYVRLAEQGMTRLGGRGGRTTGFERDGVTHIPDEVCLIHEAADRILAGEKTGAICRDFTDRGFTTVTGGPWSHGALKKLMLRPRLAGLVAHHGAILGKAAWEPILDRERWEAVCAVLEHKAAAFDYTTNVGRYLLSGIARCGSCGEPVVVRHNTRGTSLLGYGCITKGCQHKVHRAMRYVDPYVEGAVIRFLNDDAFRSRMRPQIAGNLATELVALEKAREKILADFADDDDPDLQDMVRVKLRRNRERTEDVRGKIVDSQKGRILGDLWGIDLARWKGLGLSRQRAAVNALMVVTILPTGRRGPGFNPDSVRLEQR